MKKSANSTYLIISIYYLIFYITLGVFSPYLNVYYERLGFTGSQIGLITSLGLIAAMCITPLWGTICDKTRNTKGVMAFLLLATAVSVFFWQFQTLFIPTLILAVIVTVFRTSIPSLSDGLAIDFCSENKKDFGLIRSMGSLGYLIGAFVIANVLLHFGINGPYVQVLIVCSVISAVLLFQIPNNKVSNEEKQKISFKNSILTLSKNKNYVFVLVIMLLTTMVLDASINYTGNHLIYTLKQNDSMIGFSSCAQVLPEVLIIMFSNRIFKRLKTSQVFLVGIIAQIVRFVIYATASNIYLFLLASTLHGLTLAAGSVGYVSYIHKSVDKTMLATSMALYSTTNTIGSIIANMVFGMIYQYSSSYGIYWVVCICAVLAAVLVIKNKNLDESQ